MEKKTGIDPEEYAKKFPIVKYDVQPNANGNNYDEDSLKKMVDEWHGQKSMAVYQTPELDTFAKQMQENMTKAMEKNMHDSIMSGMGLAPGKLTFPTSQSLNPQDLQNMISAISNEPATVHRDAMTVKQVMDLLNVNDLIDNAVLKLGRKISLTARNSIRDYMIRISKSILLDKDQPGPTGKDSEFTKPLFEELLTIEGVEKAEMMMDDYPESVSIIIRLNMSDFPDDLVDINMDKIDYAIQANKPQHLEKLEVLFHNKVVY